MKHTYLALAATALLSVVNAFPQMRPDQMKNYAEHSKKSAETHPLLGMVRRSKKSKRSSTFNAQEQLIDVTGEHAFIPPNFDAGDQRGPCPGLNALANHNYLPHNGVADMTTIIKATNEAYGMSLDLGGFLAVYGTVFDGNPLSTNPGYSIGGPSQYSQNILDGADLLGTPTGLSGSHNKYEADVSPTRGDLYVEGNNLHVVRDRFIDYYYQLLENTPAPQQYSALAPFHKQRFDESVNTNPYFFYPPFAGVLVSPAGYSFPARMMANHSAEYPEGYLDRQTFASFFGVTGDNRDNFVVNQGWERIPDNWYKRPIDDEFSIPDFVLDILEHAAYYPRLLSIGGNTGKVNTFTGIDIANLTGGVFNAATLLEGNNLECFIFQAMIASAPDILGTTFNDVQRAEKPLLDNVMNILGSLECPQLETYDQKLFEGFPGYAQAYGSYAGLSQLNVDEAVTGVVGGLVPTGQK